MSMEYTSSIIPKDAKTLPDENESSVAKPQDQRVEEQQQDNTKESPSESIKTILHDWTEWVPMQKELHSAVQLMNLIMLQKVHEMFTAADIPYWICGGTLLGAIRHGGFIPHDDDVDIECFEKDMERISSYLPLDPPIYTGFEPNSGKWEGVHPICKLQFFRGEFTVGVFPRPENLPQEQHFCSKEEAFPLKLYKFCNINVWGPNQVDLYLKRLYGPNCLDQVSVWNHDYNWYHGKNHSPTRTVLSLQKYNCVVKEAAIVPPLALESAEDTYNAFCNTHNEDEFLESYKKYRFERVWRRNRQAAEWREAKERERDNNPQAC